MADVEAMYHQVKIPFKDCDCLCFLWPKGGIMVEYRMTSHLFRGVWCAASSTYALRQSVQDLQCSELVEKTVDKAFYVDDMFKSVKTLSEGVEVTQGTREVLRQSGFDLTKFVSNELSLISIVPDEDRASEVKDLSDIWSKALGIKWNVSRDCFYYVSTLPTMSEVITKRVVLSHVSSMYDPLGLVSPIVFQGKILFQEVVRLQISWDEYLPNDLSKRWFNWIAISDNEVKGKYM